MATAEDTHLFSTAQDKGNSIVDVAEIEINGDHRPDFRKPMLLKLGSSYSLRGFVNGSDPTIPVANFLGVPYARIPARFRQAVLIDPTQNDGIVDATEYGPRCPQPIDVLHDLTSYLYPAMATHAPVSEFGCLNLNVYAPAAGVGTDGYEPLPVLLWIHGGAFTYGDGSCEFDGNFLVRYSSSLGKPIIVISLNYRLGYFGFMSSKELDNEAKCNNEVGYTNLGLHDQRVAMEWIKTNIHHFGGDPNRLTIAGESAGAFSCLAHLRANAPLFQSAFILSCPTIALQNASERQATFDRLVTQGGNLSLSAPAGDKLTALRSLSTFQIQALLNGGHAAPAWDSNFWPSMHEGELVDEVKEFHPWTDLVTIGQTRDECAFFCGVWRGQTVSDLRDNLEHVFPDPSFRGEVLSAYSLTDASTHAQLVEAHIQISTDCLFSLATQRVAEANGKIWAYTFDQCDWSDIDFIAGTAYHSLDNPFFFYLPAVTTKTESRDIKESARVYATACVEVVNGNAPWEQYGANSRVMAIDGLKSGMQKKPFNERWRSLVSTKQREAMFSQGRALLMEAMRKTAEEEAERVAKQQLRREK